MHALSFKYNHSFKLKSFGLFIGNKNIRELTNDGYTYLRIELMDHDCVWKYAEYSYFNVESAISKYRLHVNGYTGNAGKSFCI